jgi:cytochrome bd ubiquinol oxidase subunit I
MSDLLAARLQMAFSLGFHIIFASISIAMPFFMAVSHLLWLRTDRAIYLHLTKAWSKGVAIFFATGAVSGTILSFELGLLWPKFMQHAGPIIGMPFSWEGTIFFLEAIALGLFLYGWGRMNPLLHWLAGVVVGICGVLSSVFVICANGWMNSPTGFTWINGKAINIDPYRAMFNDAFLLQGLHMVVAAFQAAGFAVAGIHAYLLIKDRINLFHLQALKIALTFAVIASLIQPILGDLSAKSVARRQPAKLAAMESLFKTQRGAPLIIGGIPDDKNQTVNYAIELPKALSFLAFNDFNAEVKGLNEFPKDERPPVTIVHLAFQIMVGIGSLLALISVWLIYRTYRNRDFLLKTSTLLIIASLTPLGFLAIEAGWIVTEVGRQPWIIYNIMKTSDSLTPMPGLVYTFYLHAALYLLLTFLVTFLMVRQIKAVTHKDFCYKI